MRLTILALTAVLSLVCCDKPSSKLACNANHVIRTDPRGQISDSDWEACLKDKSFHDRYAAQEFLEAQKNETVFVKKVELAIRSEPTVAKSAYRIMPVDEVARLAKDGLSSQSQDVALEKRVSTSGYVFAWVEDKRFMLAIVKDPQSSDSFNNGLPIDLRRLPLPVRKLIRSGCNPQFHLCHVAIFGTIEPIWANWTEPFDTFGVSDTSAEPIGLVADAVFFDHVALSH